MKSRMVILTSHTLLAIFKDYMGPDQIDQECYVRQLLFKPTEQGKFAFIVESPTIAQDAAPIQVHFDIKRIYGVGGGAS